MISPSMYPQELLKSSIEDRKNYFKSYTMKHQTLGDKFEDLMTLIREPSSAGIILVYGPSGVGKSTLKRMVERTILLDKLPEMERDRGIIPVACVDVIPPENGNFHWGVYYRRALNALNEPLIDKKITRASTGIGGSVSALRDSLESAFKHRSPNVFIADEAQHLRKIAGARRLQDQFDIIKSIADTTGVLHVLIGTYELLPFRNLNGQLSRRGMEIHFQRYQATEKDIVSFKRVINTFQHHIPIEEIPDLLSIWEFLYERSIGCVGILKDWLVRAVDKALTNGGKFTIELIEKTAFPVSACEKMAMEAVEGEMLLAQEESTRRRLRYLIGLDKINENEYGNKTANKKGNQQPGKRNPVRDVVGNVL